jgi:hypothetical protein
VTHHLTGSALSVGLMLMATAVPTLLLGLIVGVFKVSGKVLGKVEAFDRQRKSQMPLCKQAHLAFLFGPFCFQSILMC